VLTLGATVSRSGESVVTPIDRSGYIRRMELMSPLDDVPHSRPVLTFTQLTDTHITDEESPLRTEFLDSLLRTAYRPPRKA
jgi:hypothetical protein